VQRSIPVVGLVVAFAALVGVTLGGVAANWPGHRSIPGSAAFASPRTDEATVVAIQTVRCPSPGSSGCESVQVRLASGPDHGNLTSLAFSGGGTPRFGVGDRVLVYKNKLPPHNGSPGGPHVPAYGFSDFQRRAPMLWLLLLFGAVVVAAGRLHGLRALAGLAASLATVVFFIVPAIADGKPPVQVAAFGGLGVMLLTIPLVHGGGAKSLAACLGTATALLLTLLLADLFTRLAHLSGLSSDEAVYLQATTHVSMQGLLLAGMVIGSLGVLADTTVTQASTVLALRRANPALGFRGLVGHATSVGRDHIAATVNTLVLAYTGAALPLLIVFTMGGTSFQAAVNSEAVAGAIVSTLVGSIGLISAVPATTALAAMLALHLPERRLGREHLHAHAH
jgi:uncharacterized membrane protein